MAGGSLVVTAAGGLLGSAYGIKAFNSYIVEDDSFDIQCVCKGSGTTVLIVRGFTTEKKVDWRTEVKSIEAAYPDSPIYLVTWDSKEMLELARFLALGAGLAGGAVLNGMFNLATALGGASGTENEVRVEPVHLMGAAIGQDTRRDSAGEALSGVIHNCHSHSDVVLG